MLFTLQVSFNLLKNKLNNFLINVLQFFQFFTLETVKLYPTWYVSHFYTFLSRFQHFIPSLPAFLLLRKLYRSAFRPSLKFKRDKVNSQPCLYLNYIQQKLSVPLFNEIAYLLFAFPITIYHSPRYFTVFLKVFQSLSSLVFI